MTYDRDILLIQLKYASIFRYYRISVLAGLDQG
mgnify:CR=1 FL=1